MMINTMFTSGWNLLFGSSREDQESNNNSLSTDKHDNENVGEVGSEIVELEESIDESAIPILPPFIEQFSTYEEAKVTIENHGRQYGYGITIQRSKKYPTKRGEIQVVTLQCNCSGEMKPLRNADGTPRERIRNTRSMKTGCKYQVCIIGSRLDRYRVVVKTGSHNHQPSLHPSCHASFRRIDRQRYSSMIQSGILAGRKPNAIISDIRYEQQKLGKDHNMLIAIPTSKDISNIKGAEKLEHLDGLNPTQAYRKKIPMLEDH